jgi:hypothetical protein
VAFGEIILDHIDKTGIQRQTVEHANFFVIREHNLPAVLVENGHHTNAADRAKLMSDEFLDNLALAYLDAVIAYFDDGNAHRSFIPAGLLYSSLSRARHTFRISWFDFGSRSPLR